MKWCNILQKAPLVRAHKTFPGPNSSPDSVAVSNAGEKIIINVHGGEDVTLNT